MQLSLVQIYVRRHELIPRVLDEEKDADPTPPRHHGRLNGKVSTTSTSATSAKA